MLARKHACHLFSAFRYENFREKYLERKQAREKAFKGWSRRDWDGGMMEYWKIGKMENGRIRLG